MEPLGKLLSRFPLEPTYAKALLASHYMKCENLMVMLVSVLSAENVWAPASRHDENAQQRLKQVRKRLASRSDEKSDHMILVHLCGEWEKVERSREQEWCHRNFAQSRALKQAKNIK